MRADDARTASDSDAELPLVSILMSAFNAESTIDEALSSLEAQSYDRWELVICDDASTDATLEKIEAFAMRSRQKVRVLSNSVNLRLAASLNRCLAEAQGSLVARMDADDVSHPDRFMQQVAFLRAHHDVHLVGTAMRRFDDRGQWEVLSLPPQPDRWTMRNTVPFAHATIMCRSEVMHDLGGYVDLPRTLRCEDHDLWFRFFAAGCVGRNLSEALYLVRDDAGAIRRRTMKSRSRSFRTTLVGYRNLDYPVTWYVWPVLHLAKGLAPVWVVSLTKSVVRSARAGRGLGQNHRRRR